MIAVRHIQHHVELQLRAHNGLTQMTRILLGFFLAPLMPCFIIIILATITGGSGAEFWVMIILLISYPVCLFVGAPVYIIFENYNITGLVHYIIAGMAASIIAILFVFFFNKLSISDFHAAAESILSIHYAIMGLMVVVGGIISTTFWFIARPDRSGHRRRPTL
jgi:branched-subunit amino acid transport protein AzlD